MMMANNSTSKRSRSRYTTLIYHHECRLGTGLWIDGRSRSNSKPNVQYSAAVRCVWFKSEKSNLATSRASRFHILVQQESLPTYTNTVKETTTPLYTYSCIAITRTVKREKEKCVCMNIRVTIVWLFTCYSNKTWSDNPVYTQFYSWHSSVPSVKDL